MAEKTVELTRRAAEYGISASPPNEPEEIQAQIAQIRAEMGRTIDEIQLRLSPEYIKEQAQETIREATIGKVEKMAHQVENKVDNWRANAIGTIRENPIPVALIGLGVGWLLFKGNDSYDEEAYYGQRPYAYDTRYPYSYDPRGSRYTDYEEPDIIDRTRERVADAAHDAREWVEEKVERVEDKTAEFAQQARQKKDETMQSLREQAQAATEQTEHAAHYVQRRARRQMARARHTFWDTLDENPLALGMVAMAAGALAGLVLPGTEVEDRYMGEMRDNLVEEAKHTVQETAHKVQNVAEKAQEAAVEEGKREAERQELVTPKRTASYEEIDPPLRTPTNL